MKWSAGPAEWTVGEDAYLSVAFTWQLHRAYMRASWFRQMGYRVHVGGPALFVKTPFREGLKLFARVGGDFADAVVHHNPNATFASRGCPVGCWFCVVPAMEGRDFTLIEDFPVRPILCDNNLSALPPEYQDHVVSRYEAAGVPLLDANSGFEPRTFTPEVYHGWRGINRGPWRFALDDQGEKAAAVEALAMLRGFGVRPRRIRVYVLIGNEPVDACMERVQLVIDGGGEPHVQPLMKLNALRRRPWVRFDWTERKLKDVARWANRHIWRKTPFKAYDRRRRR